MYRWEIFFYSLQACKYDDFLFLFLIILYFVLFYPLFVVRVKIIKMYDCIFSRAWAFLVMAVNLSERSPTTLSTLYSVLYKTAWLIFFGFVFFFVRCCFFYLRLLRHFKWLFATGQRERKNNELRSCGVQNEKLRYLCQDFDKRKQNREWWKGSRLVGFWNKIYLFRYFCWLWLSSLEDLNFWNWMKKFECWLFKLCRNWFCYESGFYDIFSFFFFFLRFFLKV